MINQRTGTLKLKKLTGKSQEQLNFNINEPPKTTANDLNKFLASIVQSLPPLSYEFPDIPVPFSLPHISPLDVVKKIEKLKRSSICPLDIPVPLIKAFSDYLSKPLSTLFNEITESGQFPQYWKQGFITPIKKKNGKPGFDGIRPITLTSIFSKLYESFLADWLKMKVLPLIDLRQFGNLKSTSTSHYLIHLVDTMGKLLEKPNTWLNLISIDLQKAFDLINHNLLIDKLINEFHIETFLVKLVASFLSNRSQAVKYLNCFSDHLPIFNGIPQGTILGPLLFSLMINSLSTLYDNRWKFVDDLTVLEICHKNIFSNPMGILQDIACEASSLDMTVNPSKSAIVSVSFLKSPPLFLAPIPPETSVTSLKLLGVTISSNLKWDAHINNILRQANSSLSLLKLLNKFSCPQSHLLQVYISFVRPILEYACPVWHPGLSNEATQKIENVQKRALRIIFKEGMIPYLHLLNISNLETLERRRNNLCLRFGKLALLNPRTANLFPEYHVPDRNRPPRTVSQPIPTLSPILCTTLRYKKSFIPFFLLI